MSGPVHAVNWVLRRVFRTLCKIDMKEAAKLPRSGPCILVGNHISFLEVPVFMSEADNPLITGMAKKESWKNPLFHFLFDRWEVIPLDRNEIDREAFRMSVDALARGKILAISPEGTRSMDGRMLRGKPGVLAVAIKSRAPIIPIGFYGYVDFWKNLKRLRRTEFHMRVGQPFRLELGSDTPGKEIREAATDEIMYKIAECLPEEYHGVYAHEGPVQYRYAVPL